MRRGPVLAGLIVHVLASAGAHPARAVAPDFRIHADEFPAPPAAPALSRLLTGLDADGTPISALTAEGHANAEALVNAATWDFRGLGGSFRVGQVAPSDAPWTCYLDPGPVDPNDCGLDRSDLLLVIDDVDAAGVPTGGRTLTALGWDDASSQYRLRAQVLDEGDRDAEQRLCFNGADEVPFVEFGNDDGGRRYVGADEGPFLPVPSFDCEGVACDGVECGGDDPTACGALDDEQGTAGVIESRTRAAGTMTLPSGHVVDALVLEVRFDLSVQASFFGDCNIDAAVARQYLVAWLVPEYGPLVQVFSPANTGSLASWTSTSSTNVGFGLLPPVSIRVDAVGPDSITVSWDPGERPELIDGHVVHWDTRSGSTAEPRFDSGVVTGTSHRITGLELDTEYFVSVSSVATYQDPLSGVVTEYRSIELPTSIGADVDGDGVRDTSYPPEVSAITAEPTGRLAINRVSVLAPTGTEPPLAEQFAATCQVPDLRLCPSEIVDGPLDGLRLADEALTSGTASLWLYEHDDAAEDARLARDGGDLVFRVP